MERCPQCGNPRYVCQNDDPDIAFQIREETCNVMRKKSQHEEAVARKTKSKPRPGVQVGAEAYTYSRTDLADFREPFYTELMKRRELLEAGWPTKPRKAPPGKAPDA